MDVIDSFTSLPVPLKVALKKGCKEEGHDSWMYRIRSENLVAIRSGVWPVTSASENKNNKKKKKNQTKTIGLRRVACLKPNNNVYIIIELEVVILLNPR